MDGVACATTAVYPSPTTTTSIDPDPVTSANTHAAELVAGRDVADVANDMSPGPLVVHNSSRPSRIVTYTDMVKEESTAAPPVKCPAHTPVGVASTSMRVELASPSTAAPATMDTLANDRRTGCGRSLCATYTSPSITTPSKNGFCSRSTGGRT